MMTTFSKGGIRLCTFAALTCASALSGEQAVGRVADQWSIPGDSGPLTSSRNDAARNQRWIVQPGGDLAVVAAGAGESGIFMGIQCDPFDANARRLILGIRQNAVAPEMRSALRGTAEKFRITASGQAITSTFDAAPEDRGRTTFYGAADYIAAYLTPAQLATIVKAEALQVKVGTKVYPFTGYGAGRALNAMVCKTKSVHIASRLIEGHRDNWIASPKGIWRVNFHAGNAALIKGTVDASVNATSKFVDEGTSFKLGVACIDDRLYARVDADFAPGIQSDDFTEKTANFISSFDRLRKMVEIYRRGERLGGFALSKTDMAGPGRQISALDVANLMEADSIVVSSGTNAVDFPTNGSSIALGRILNTCRKKAASNTPPADL